MIVIHASFGFEEMAEKTRALQAARRELENLKRVARHNEEKRGGGDALL